MIRIFKHPARLGKDLIVFSAEQNILSIYDIDGCFHNAEYMCVIITDAL